MQPPLFIVTRAAEQSATWVQALQAAGCAAQALPLIAINAVADPVPLQRAWQALAAGDLVVFVSANAVDGFFAASAWLTPATTSLSAPVWPTGVFAASTGPGTSCALLDAGVPASALIEPAADAAQFDSEALWLQLQPRLAPWLGRRVWVARGEDGRDWLARTLVAQGAQVQFLCAYRRVQPQPSAADQALIQTALAQPQSHVWLFSSSQAVQQLQQWVPQADWRHSQAWASHPRIAQTASDAGFGRVALVRPGVDAAVAQARCIAAASTPVTASMPASTAASTQGPQLTIGGLRSEPP